MKKTCVMLTVLLLVISCSKESSPIQQTQDVRESVSETLSSDITEKIPEVRIPELTETPELFPVIETEAETQDLPKKRVAEEIIENELNISLSPNIISTHSNAFIELQNNSSQQVLYVTIGGYSYELTEHEGKHYFEIQKDTFAGGEYFISVQYPDGTIVGLDQQMIVQAGQDSEINLRNITPNRITSDTDTSIVLQGNGFEKIVSVQLDNNIILKEANFDIINDQVMSIEIPAGIPAGEYFFNFLTLEKVVELKQNSLRIDTP